MNFKDEHVDDFKKLFNERKERIRNFSGCTYLELWQDEHQASIFYTYSIWNQASDLENYRVSELFQDTWATVKKWFNAKPQAFSTNKIIEMP
jgi:hypothetical protein